MYKIVITETAFEQLKSIEPRIRKQIQNKIEILKNDPGKRGKSLRGLLSEYRSIRAAGQRYRIIYKIEKENIIVIVVALGIRKDGDKKDIYTLMKKLINSGLLE